MAGYDKNYFIQLEKAERMELPRNLRILNLIEEYCRQGRILDIGIGTGLFLKLAKSHRWEVYGIDVSEYAISRLKKSGFKLFKGELSENNFTDKSFDVVNMRHSLEHIKDPRKTLTKAYNILKLGGILCIATPDSFGIHAKLAGKHWPHLSIPYHLHFFSKKSLSDLVEEIGFTVLKIKTEELTIYDIFKLLLFRLGLPVPYQNPSKISKIFSQMLTKISLGEGLVLIAKKGA